MHLYLPPVRTSRSGRLYGPEAQSNDSFDPVNCELTASNECIETCLLKRFNEQRPYYYGLVGPGTNCQEWSDDQFQRCLESCF